MSNIRLKFEYEKDTKNRVRYQELQEEGKAPVVGTLYVQKWFAGSTKHIESPLIKKINKENNVKS